MKQCTPCGIAQLAIGIMATTAGVIPPIDGLSVACFVAGAINFVLAAFYFLSSK